MTKLEKAIQLYEKIIEIKSKQFVHNKINTCLPKKKQKVQEVILTQLTVKLFNARSAFNAAFSKLSASEKSEFIVGRKIV